MILAPLILAPLLGLGVRPHAQQRDLALAGKFFQEGGPAERAMAAARALERAALQNPWRQDLWEPAGHLALQGGDAQASIGYFLMADGAGSLSAHGRLALGRAYRQTGNLAFAIQTWEGLRDRQELLDEVLPLLLEAHRSQGDISAEMSDLQAITALNPADAGMRHRLGLLLATRDPLAALAHLAQAAELDPGLQPQTGALIRSIRTASLQGDSASLLLEAGRALAAQDDWDLAAMAFENALVVRPENADAWAFLGEALQRQSPPTDGALPALERALELDPTSLSANSLLALYWQRQGDYPAALAHLQQALQYHPENPALLADLGNTLAMTGDLEAGLQAHRRAITLSPGNPAYYRLLVEFCIRYEYQVRQSALPAARQAVLLDGKDPANLDAAAQVFILLGDLYSAERYLLRALQAGDRHAPAYLHLGLVYMLQGNRQDARQEWEQAIRLAPGSAVAEQSARLLQNYFP